MATLAGTVGYVGQQRWPMLLATKDTATRKRHTVATLLATLRHNRKRRPGEEDVVVAVTEEQEREEIGCGNRAIYMNKGIVRSLQRADVGAHLLGKRLDISIQTALRPVQQEGGRDALRWR